MQQQQIVVSLSKLVPSKKNVRKVKAGKEAHHRLVALIRSQGLLQPLVVCPVNGDGKAYRVIAGNRRLSALREVHKGSDPKIPCVLRKVDGTEADALALGENFGREAMHPLDEAEAFAKLATADGKDAPAIASEFGVTDHYVKQRMKLASLCDVVKNAYREDQIDTATAEAFAAVPEDRQRAVWEEVGGRPRHAEHVRNVIAHAWVDASHALFDLSTLPDGAVSRDLFGDRVLVERQAFMDAQVQALEKERHTLTEDGWSEVVVGKREDVQDRLYSMAHPEREYDVETTKKLERVIEKRNKLEEKEVAEDDEKGQRAWQEKYESLEAEEREILEKAPVHFSEATKAVGTAFLVLDADGWVHREYRVPRRRQTAGNGSGHGGEGTSEKPTVPTSDELSERQLATTFTHQALAVREALLENPKARKCILALLLHNKVRSEALSVRHEPNGTTLHASSDDFHSPAYDHLKQLQSKLDPFANDPRISDCDGYDRLTKLSDKKLDALIDVLLVSTLTAHMQRPTPLLHKLHTELKVDIRAYWRPDTAWLSGYKKCQLAHLITELKGSVHAPSPDRKKSDLVIVLAQLFTDAAEGKLADNELADRVNRWVPVNLREDRED